jgi:predicted nucleotidyltransferase
MLDLIEQHRAEIEELCRRHQVAKLELFGSAATGEFRPETSDLDFLVEFLPLAPGTSADAYFGMLHGLEDLLHCKIDLVMTAAIRNRFFRRAVDQQGTPLYAA